MEEKKESSKDDKKELITEKILGRRLTPLRFFKIVVVALICGAAFGISSAVFIYLMEPVLRRVEAEIDTVESMDESVTLEDGSVIQGDGGVPASFSSSENPDGQSFENPEDLVDESFDRENRDTSANESFEAPLAQGTGNFDRENPDGQSFAGSDRDTSAYISDTEPQSADVNHSANPSGNDFHGSGFTGENTTSDTNMMDIPSLSSDIDPIDTSGSEEALDGSNYIGGFLELEKKEAVSNIETYIVRVEGTLSETTWFGSEALESEENAGVIIDINEDEILILTTSDAVDFETLDVTFYNGIFEDGYVKQISRHDKLAVLAVARTNEKGEDIMTLAPLIKAVEFAGIDDIYIGRSVVACGAPLGVAGSFAFGDIGFIRNEVSGLDMDLDIFYVSCSASTDKGTFFIDSDGTFLGVGSERDSGEALAGATDGVTECTSSLTLQGIVEKLKKGEQIAFFGISGIAVTDDMSSRGIPQGIYITGIELSGPAYTAGLMRGDIITSIDGHRITDMSGLSSVIFSLSPGDEIKIQIQRPGGDGSYEELEFDSVTSER